MSEYDWLPPLLKMEAFGNDLDQFLDGAYRSFRAEFVENRPTLLGKVVDITGPARPGEKEETFLHITSSDGPWGRKEDPPRCERIRYPLAMIRAVPSARVHAWRDAHRRNRLQITLPDFSYLVALHETQQRFILLTAYVIYAEHQRRGLQKRWEVGEQIC